MPSWTTSWSTAHNLALILYTATQTYENHVSVILVRSIVECLTLMASGTDPTVSEITEYETMLEFLCE